MRARLTESLLDYYTKIEREVSPLEENRRAGSSTVSWELMVLNVGLAILVERFSFVVSPSGCMVE